MADAQSMLLQTPPGEDPVEYAKAVRQAEIAQAMQGMALQPIGVQQPSSGVGGKYVAARVSPLSGVSRLVEALMAKRGIDKSNTQMAQIYANGLRAFQPGGQPMPQTDPNVPMSGNSGGPGAHDAGQPLGQSVANPMNPYGQDPHALMRLYMADPQKYLEAVKGTPEWQNALLANGGNTGAAQHQMLAQAQKAAMVETKPGQTQTNLITGQSFVAPDVEKGFQVQGDPTKGPVSAAEVPGSTQIAANREAATTAAQKANTPVQGGTDLQGRPLLTTPQAGPGVKQYFPTSQTIGAQTTAAAESQKKSGSLGQDYANDLAKDSAGAIDVVRGLHEMKNLAKVATPNAANTMKMQLGSMLIAGGADPDSVSAFLHVDIGALQAAAKQTSSLAVASIHQMTNRGTNFDLDTFMRNNPNLAMSPGGYSRVIDYMEKKSKDIIAKQKDFNTWRRTANDGKPVPEEDWYSGHTEHWNDRTLKEIESGASNSRPPIESFHTP